MKNVGLVLEGGGMRGVFTSGVVDGLLEKNLEVPYIIGVSAGACNAMNYVSKQHGRSKIVNIDALEEHKYIKKRNLISMGSIFDMELLFKKFPYDLYPYDFDEFYSSKTEYTLVTTNCNTGKAEYFKKIRDKDKMLDALKASCSLPFVSPIVWIDGKPMLDGGVGDSIPILKSIEDGNEKNIIVLTRPKGYRKKASKEHKFQRMYYSKYPNLVKAIVNRNKYYNQTLDIVEKLEEEGKVYVLRLSGDFSISRFEKDTDKLLELYNFGRKLAIEHSDRIVAWAEA